MKKSKIIAAALAASVMGSSFGVFSANAAEVSVNNVTIHGNTVPTYLTDYTGEAFMQRIQQETDEHFRNSC